MNDSQPTSSPAGVLYNSSTDGMAQQPHDDKQAYLIPQKAPAYAVPIGNVMQTLACRCNTLKSSSWNGLGCH